MRNLAIRRFDKTAGGLPKPGQTELSLRFRDADMKSQAECMSRPRNAAAAENDIRCNHV